MMDPTPLEPDTIYRLYPRDELKAIVEDCLEDDDIDSLKSKLMILNKLINE